MCCQLPLFKLSVVEGFSPGLPCALLLCGAHPASVELLATSSLFLTEFLQWWWWWWWGTKWLNTAGLVAAGMDY